MKLLISFLLFLPYFCISAKVTNINSSQYLKVQELVTEIRKNDKDSTILLVSDFDNTLMKPLNLLGSDQFYEWQAGLIKANDPKKDFLNFDEFIEVHSKAMTLTNMTLTDPEIPSILASLNEQNVRMFILTSRSPIFRAITSRDLNKYGLNIASLSPVPDYFYEGKLNGREVYFHRGIFFTSGLNKGEALFHLLSENKLQYSHIIFIDDMEKHTIAVTEYVTKNPELDKKINLTTIRFSKEDQAKENFLKNTKKAKQEIKAFKLFLKKYFP